ncbi:serine/threonine-protein kinase PRP4 homolog [Saccostrea cucullata]|uniref:serine/threonine-protein kinase PRP4 homolog n=1 Tax=Saccostrea cuccullata TaxID=36930 RepID=UPI002ED1E5CA
MAYFDRNDLQLVVFFPVDKTVHVMAKNRVDFKNDEEGSVVVLWQTSDIEDDGKMVLKEMPYNGYIVFSGSLQKCRGFIKQIKEEVLPECQEKETSTLVESMRKLSEEMRKSGKRGSSLKLKRVLEEENDDGSRKKTKKSQRSKPETTSTGSTAKTGPSRATKLNDLKLKELEAFAGIAVNKTPVNSPQKSPVSETPAKSPQRKPVNKTPVKAPRRTPVKSLQRKPVNKTPVKSPQRKPVNKSPVKSPQRKPVNKTPVKSPQREQVNKTPVKSPQREQVNKTPVKSLQRKPVNKTPVKSPQREQVNKTPVKSPQRKPVNKTPVKSPQRKPVNKTPVKSPQRKPFNKTPVKSPQRKPVNKTPVKAPRRTPVKSQKKTQFKSPSKNLDMPPAVETSFIIGQGLGILNEDTSINFDVDNGMETGNMLDPSFPEYGYNASNSTPCFQTSTTQGSSNFSIPSDPSPMDNLTGYYRGLNYDQQCQILSFLNVLTNTLQNYTYGTNYAPVLETPGPSSDPSSSQDATPSVETPTIKEPRLLPLIHDENNTFGDVLVNPSQLRTAEMKALTTSTSKNGGIYLLNKVVEIVFKKEELRTSKGVKGLDQHKLEAIQEYMHTKCRTLQLEPVPPKLFNKTIQNKIGNIRHESKGKTRLVGKKDATKSS